MIPLFERKVQGTDIFPHFLMLSSSVNEMKLVEASVGEGSEHVQRHEGAEMTYKSESFL